MGGLCRTYRPLFLVLSLASAVPAMGQTASLPTTSPAIQQAIRDLGSDTWQVREDAVKKLWEAGKEAEPSLCAVAAGAHKEAAARAAAILGKFRMGIYPDTPEEVVALIMEMWTSTEVNKKKQAFTKLSSRGALNSKLLLRLAVSAEGADLHYFLCSWVEDRLVRDVRLLAQGQNEPAEDAFALGAELDSEPALCIWAAYITGRGQAQDKIRQLADPASPGEGRLLAFLLRANGERKRAAEAAAKVHDDRLARAFLLESGDWATAAQLPITERHGPGTLTVEQGALEIGRRMAVARLTGSKDDWETSLSEAERLWKGITGKPNVTGQYEVIYAMLLNEQWDRAMQMMQEEHHVEHVVDFLIARTCYREAAELAERPEVKASAVVPAWCWSKLHGILGHRKQLVECTQNPQEPTGPEAHVAWFRRAGLVKEAMPIAAKLLSRPRPEEEPGILASLFDTEEAPAWWSCLKRLSPREAVAVRLEKVRSIMQGDLEDAAVTGLLDEAAKGATPQDVLGLALFAERRGFVDMARRLALVAAAGPLSDRQAGRLGYLLLHMKEYEPAAAQYAVLSKPDRPDAVAMWLQGWALQQAGKKEQGAKLMALGDFLALASVSARVTLAEQMSRLGLKEEAARQRRLALRFAKPMLQDGGDNARQAAEGLNESAGDCRESANLLESYRLFMLTGGGVLSNDGAARLAYSIHDRRMRACLLDGDFAVAEAELTKCLEAQPLRLDAVFPYVREMDRRSQKAKADAAFEKVWGTFQSVLEKHPDSSGVLDEQAWLGACSRRKLVEALALAERAVQLRPEEPRPLSTLAEVCFQLDKKDQAIAAIRKAMRLDARGSNVAPFLRRQLLREFNSEARQ